MASIYRKRDSWQVQWTDPATRKRLSRTFTNRSTAERFGSERDDDLQLVRQGLATAHQVSDRRYPLTIDELCDRFTEHAKDYYRKPDGRQTRTFGNFTDALKPLRQLCGSTPAADFGPLALKRVREEMISVGWSRGTVNQQIGRVRAVFKWGVEQEYVPPVVIEGLRAVAPLKRGRCNARETEPVHPVPAAHIRALRRYSSRQVWAMVELQRLTGMRPGEVVSMRSCDLDMSGAVWTYTPVEHKTEHHGHGRSIFVGPRAQTILRPFLRPDLMAYLFSPREAERARRTAAALGHRRSGQPETGRKTDRRIGDRYTTESYRRAISRVCDLAGVPRWSPNQLRHNHGTRIRRDFGLDVAQTILGHRLGSTVTEIYAEANVRKAREVIAKVG